MTQTRICKICAQEFPLTKEFYYGTTSKGIFYFNRACKTCQRPSKYINTVPSRLKKCHYKRQSLYGISAEQYAQMVTAQQGRCAVCQQFPKDGKLCVDHVHGSQPLEIRGLCCRQCNAGIGLLGDTLPAVEAAVAYLKRYESSKDVQLLPADAPGPESPNEP